MPRKPDNIPSGYGELQQREYPWGLMTGLSAFLFLSVALVIFPSQVTMFIHDPRGTVAMFLSLENRISYVGLAIMIFAILPEIHEQTHQLAAKAIGLEPTYRRWIPFRGGGYVLIQETWITRSESNIMTVATVLILNPLFVTLFFVLPNGILRLLAGLMFVFNSSMLTWERSQ